MEEAVQFSIANKKLYGILHYPSDNMSNLIIIMVTGGPQTRIGSHRLYVQLARFLSKKNFLVFRFDYEGLGDSEGDFIGFRGAIPSINAAIDFASVVMLILSSRTSQ